MHYFSTYFDIQPYMFRTDLLSIIRSINTVFTALGICHTIYVDCLTVNINSMTNINCFEYSIETPDDGQ
jgi:hypothetical protein